MAVDFAAGFIGGFSSVLVGHPFDTIKVRLQTQDSRNPRYRGVIHCFMKSFRAEGVAGLYKGMSFPLGGMAVVNAVAFGAYGNVLRVMSDPDSLQSHFVAGAFSGIAQSFISSPLELARTRLQLQGQGEGWSNVIGKQGAVYAGPLDCVKKIVGEEGLRRGLFKGLGITVVRDAPAFAIYFSAYELMCRLLSVDSEGRSSVWKLSLAGALGGAISWLPTYPIDVIKSRLQSDGLEGARRFRGSIHCALVSFREEGWRVFSRGLSTALIRSFPTNATVFGVSAQVFKMADSWQGREQEAAMAVAILTERAAEQIKKKKRGGLAPPTAEIYDADYHYHSVPTLQFPGAHFLVNGLLKNMDNSYHSVLYSMHINFRRRSTTRDHGYFFGHNQIHVEEQQMTAAEDADSVHPTPYWPEDDNFDPHTAVKIRTEDAAIADANSEDDDEDDIMDAQETLDWRRETEDWSRRQMKDFTDRPNVSRSTLLTYAG